MADKNNKMIFSAKRALRSPAGNIIAESLGLGVAEFVSIATSLGAVAYTEELAPNTLKSVSHTVAKVIEPYILDPAEWTISHLCRLEECQPDLTKSREQRAEELTKTGIVFSIAFIASFVMKVATRKVLNHVLDLSHSPHVNTNRWAHDFLENYIKPDKHDRKILYWDEGIHLGSLILLNTGIAKQTDKMIHVTSSILQKSLGWSKQKSDRVASMTMIWEVPNVIGWLAGAGAIAHSELKSR